MTSLARHIVTLAAIIPLVVAVASSALGAERSKGGASRVVGLSFDEPKQVDFLKAVLASMKLRYAVTATPKGQTVEWVSTDPAQDREIQNRVSQFWFISTQCHGMQPPSPDQPARSNLSC